MILAVNVLVTLTMVVVVERLRRKLKKANRLIDQLQSAGRDMVTLSAVKPKTPQYFTGKRNFGAYWMSFQNEARDAGVMVDNGKGILEITIQRKVTV